MSYPIPGGRPASLYHDNFKVSHTLKSCVSLRPQKPIDHWENISIYAKPKVYSPSHLSLSLHGFFKTFMG
ncbi:hypothetical protein Mapa_005022 [Marchantia paleacea]|nr:hypothetical protein Mapa_005022 [Marchantia paleacea]